MNGAGGKIYRVGELTGQIKNLLENSYPFVAVEGEISNFRPSAAGHLYFTLKDGEAVLSAVMFRGRASRLSFVPHDGRLVVARGGLSVYPQRGVYQLVCEALDPAGEGEILAMLEQRKRRLTAEGLFDRERKKKLPPYPKKVAVITSPTGAALRDVLKVLERRHGGIHVVVLPTLVQGEEAEELIAAQIRRANLFRMADVIILGRGGGSLEDLLPFSGEKVVRAIAESEIPVISAVGHETDTSLADLAADYRAPTPSAAAEAVSAVREDLLREVRDMRVRLEEDLKNRIEKIRLLLDRFSRENMEREFRIFLQPLLQGLDDAKEGLVDSARALALAQRRRLELAAAQLETCSPYDILKRGYSIVRTAADGRILNSAAELSFGDDLAIRFYQGEADVRVEKTRPR